ncbi:MAG: hypothetical protein V3V08_05960 [Nannocystaceae bacterium]
MFPSSYRFLHRLMPRVIALGLVLLTPCLANASTPMIRGQMGTGTAGASAGWDPTWAFDVHIARGMALNRDPDRSRLTASIGLPPLLVPRAVGMRAEIGWGERFALRENWGVALFPATGLILSTDPMAQKVAWTISVGAQPGYYARGITIAALFAWRSALATHHSYSPKARDLFADRYPPETDASHIRDAPEDGWVHLGSHDLRAGLVLGIAVRNRVEIWMSAGANYQPALPPVLYNPLGGRFPFFGNLGLNYRW